MLKNLKENWLAVVLLIVALAADLTINQQLVLLVVYLMIRQDQLISMVKTPEKETV